MTLIPNVTPGEMVKLDSYKAQVWAIVEEEFKQHTSLWLDLYRLIRRIRGELGLNVELEELFSAIKELLENSSRVVVERISSDKIDIKIIPSGEPTQES